MLTAGWDSIAVDVDDRLIFKFPRHDAAEQALRTEASLLAVIRPAVAMPVPDLILCPGPPLFSRHAKLKGEHLLAAEYERLPEAARQRLAAELALFYAQLHGLEAKKMEAAGARPIRPWLAPEVILRRAWPLLPEAFRPQAEQAIAAWQDMPPDPYGIVYGFFDGHGWNMAFDHGTNRLNGIYDFADSGFGPLQQDFIYSNLISHDLTERIAAEYETLSGRMLDRRRLEVLTTVHRLTELAEAADDPDMVKTMLGFVAAWMAPKP
ncbi:aminoglycoside phosphotransferase family protein [Telmatospirillum sp. J64-1]|uniref:aminoglycoside phosphotransferase family protein n=1 Tax=Telmatospirillum sp. J64-1 TaxID=2502183 RepID=UPI001C8F84FD|nr:aminoglycoside phosphotransferase family protein [Telmatospirillum sp. J64-1]